MAIAIGSAAVCEVKPERSTPFSVGPTYRDVRVGKCSVSGQCENFKWVTTLKQPYFITSVVWSSNKKYLSIGSGFEGLINVYDTSTWSVVSTVERWDIGGSSSLTRFSDKDADLILPRIWGKNAPVVEPTADDDVSLEKWNILSSKVIQKYRIPLSSEDSKSFTHKREVSIARAVAVSSASGELAASVEANGGEIVLFQDNGVRVLHAIKCQYRGVSTALAFSPDGTKLVAGDCYIGEVAIFNTKTGNLMFKTKVDPTAYLYNAIAFNPSGTRLAIASSDNGSGILTVLRTTDGAVVSNSPKEYATITSLQWIGDDGVLVSYEAWEPSGSCARLWQVNPISVVAKVRGEHLQIASISPGGFFTAAVFGNEVVIGKAE